MLSDLLKISHLPVKTFNTKCFPVSHQWTLHTINIAKHQWSKCTRRQQEKEPWLWPIGLILLLYTKFGKGHKSSKQLQQKYVQDIKKHFSKIYHNKFAAFSEGVHLLGTPIHQQRMTKKPARVDLLGNCYHTHKRRKKTISLFEPSKWANFVCFRQLFQQDVIFCI